LGGNHRFAIPTNKLQNFGEKQGAEQKSRKLVPSTRRNANYSFSDLSAIVAKADPCIASSRRICQRILPASRSILSLGRNSALSPLETSATCVQTIDDLERLVASYISKAESEAIAHHSNSRFSARVGRTFSTFLVNLGEYCHAYSSVIRLMEGFSHGLSSAALEILTVFVVVSDQMNPKHPDGVDMHFNNER
jgi:hypothetical protein